jgi:hypothetical protein
MTVDVEVTVEKFHKIPRATMGKYGGVLKVTVPKAGGRSQKFYFVYTGVISIVYKDYGGIGICQVPHVLKSILDMAVKNAVQERTGEVLGAE